MKFNVDLILNGPQLGSGVTVKGSITSDEPAPPASPLPPIGTLVANWLAALDPGEVERVALERQGFGGLGGGSYTQDVLATVMGMADPTRNGQTSAP